MQNNSNINGISSLAVNPQINYQNLIQQLEQAALSDAQIVESLAQQGIITNLQRQNLLSQLEEKVKAIQLYKQNVPSAIEQNAKPAPEQLSPFDLFNKEKPGFFEQGGRNVVLEYLKGLDVDKDEISKISELIEGIEKSAIEGYLKQSEHDKSLNDENSTAKSKLTSYAQGASSGSDIGKIFTREEIGKMNGEEFAKNEKLIMDQLKQGLIR